MHCELQLYPILQEVLDADDAPLKSQSGQAMARDIVQFVPFREIMRKAGPNGSVVGVSCTCMYYRYMTHFPSAVGCATYSYNIGTLTLDVPTYSRAI